MAVMPSTSGRSRRLPADTSCVTARTVTEPLTGGIGRVRELDLDQRAAGDPLLEAAVAASEVVEDAADHLATFRLVGDRVRDRGKIGLNAPLQVKGELRLHQQVRVPVAGAGRAAQEGPAVVAVAPDLDPPRLAAVAARRGDVDRPVVLERALDPLVHRANVTPPPSRRPRSASPRTPRPRTARRPSPRAGSPWRRLRSPRRPVRRRPRRRGGSRPSAPRLSSGRRPRGCRSETWTGSRARRGRAHRPPGPRY